LTLPKNLPLRLPAQVVEKRPDIGMAASDLHAASADVGVTIAARLPNLTLTRDAGRAPERSRSCSCRERASTRWRDRSLSRFSRGRLCRTVNGPPKPGSRKRRRAIETLLAAFQNVVDSLRALRADTRTLREARLAEAAARRFFEQTRAQREYGGVSQISVMIAQQSYYSASLIRVQAEGDRRADAVAFFMAIGG
jgi:outer membrane protein TolC